MGYRLEVVRRPVVPKLTRSERRSWQLHRRLSTLLNRDTQGVAADDRAQLDRLSERVTGQPHERNLERWRDLVERATCPACTAS